jgi:hypothetical protein
MLHHTAHSHVLVEELHEARRRSWRITNRSSR